MLNVNELSFFLDGKHTCVKERSELAVALSGSYNLKHLLSFFVKKEEINSAELEVKIKVKINDDAHIIIPSKVKENAKISDILNNFSSGQEIYIHKNGKGIYYLTDDGSRINGKEQLLEISEWSDDIFSLFISKLSVVFKKKIDANHNLPLFDVKINNLEITYLHNLVFSKENTEIIEDFLTHQMLNSETSLISFENFRHPIFGYKKIENIFIDENIYHRLIDELKPSIQDKEILDEIMVIFKNTNNPRPLSLYIGAEESFVNRELFDSLFITFIDSKEISNSDNIKDIINKIIEKSQDKYLRILLEKWIISNELTLFKIENDEMRKKHKTDIKKILDHFEKWKDQVLIEIEKKFKEVKNIFIKK